MRGRALELAVSRAARQYRAEGRALLVRQFPQMGTGKNGEAIYVGKAPVDFVGALGEMGAAVECKEHAGKSFPLSKLEPDQRAALDAFEEYGFDCRLVVDLTDLAEVYVVPWFLVAAFILAPWRKSLSLTWLRAFGQLCPEEERGTPQRKCLFLEAKAHPESERCHLEIIEERASSPVISLDGPEEDLDEEPKNRKPSPYAGLTLDQVRERLREACDVGLVNQMKVQSRKRVWKRRRAS